jgi:hypothetical protein
VLLHFLAGARKIMSGLQVHPELGRVLEVTGKQKRGLGSDAALPAHQFIHPVERDMQSAGEAGLSKPQRVEELLEQNLAGMGGDAKLWQHDGNSSVVIGTTNLLTIAIHEFEYDSILPVHADTVEAGAVSSQLFQSVGRRNSQVFDGRGGIQQIEFPLNPAPALGLDPAGRLAAASVMDVGGCRIPETGDHECSIP